ncbi:hypothetical protein ABI_18300 [Asticcacaulis biprosthecium C19]|uniref:Uncharacterized protein n=1 Tax=Asticcacaulis biprosthecium C19 TaxID=715226 RepID=F4QKT8_9CAUL|nr:hypothetical protein [Asticcacaulis biprosthecium]EGF93390.1 hypothetical protein ABI_18300 [Asticcacaulis biprosthecium C19]
MSTPVATASALFALTLFMVISLVTATGPANTLQSSLATVEAVASNG